MELSILSYIFGGSAAIVLIGTIVLCLYDIFRGANLYPTSTIIAIVLDSLALLALLLVMLRDTPIIASMLRSPLGLVLVISLSASLDVVAASVSIGIFVLKIAHTEPATHSEPQTLQDLTGLALSCATATLLLCFFVVVLFAHRHRCDGADESAADDAETARPKVIDKDTRAAVTVSKKESISTEIRSLAQASSMSSLRSPSLVASTFEQSILPHSPAMRSLRRQDSVLEGLALSTSLRRSLDSFEQSNAFNDWDTTIVKNEVREIIADASNSEILRRALPLETIPGSRPGSPGRPLDLVFCEVREGVSRPMMGHSIGSEHFDEQSRVARHVSEHASRPRTARGHYSTAVSGKRKRSSDPETHIHPLFRSDSPTPPPTATPSTIIHASPLGGRTMLGPPRSFLRARSASHEVLRTKLARTPSATFSDGGISSMPMNHRANSLPSRRGGVEETGGYRFPLKPFQLDRQSAGPLPNFVLTGITRT